MIELDKIARGDHGMDALIQDYSDARDDERHFLIMQGTTLTLGLAALSLLGALANEMVKAEVDFPDPLLAGAPLPVLAILAFIQSAGTQAVLRSFYMRGLEREIRARTSLISVATPPMAMAPLTWTEIVSSYTSMSRNRGDSASSFYRFMAGAIFAILWVVFGGLVAFFATQVSTTWVLIMAGVYVPLSLRIFMNALRVYRDGRGIFHVHVALANARLKDPDGLAPLRSAPTGRGRSLLNYLALPRPDDLVKVLYSLAGLVGAWLHSAPNSPSVVSLSSAVLYLFAVEYCIYQSRYQWNDIRGLHEDLSAPLREERGRLPSGILGVKPSLAAMVLRLYVVIILVSIPGPGQPAGGAQLTSFDRTILWAVVAVYLVAVPYEGVRSWVRGKGECSTRAFVVIIFLVGLGYPLRFILAWSAFGGPLDDYRLYVMAAGFWGLGIGLVALTWVLEGASYIVGKTPEGAWRLKTVSPGKLHLVVLLRLLRVPIALGGRSGDEEPKTGDELKFVRIIRWAAPSPWSLGAALWLLAVSTSGDWLVGLPEVNAAGAAIAACSILIILGVRKYELAAQLSAAVVVALWLGWHTLEATAVPDSLMWLRLIAIVLLAMTSAIFYFFFWSSSYRDTRASAQRIVTWISGKAKGLFAAFLGLPESR